MLSLNQSYSSQFFSGVFIAVFSSGEHSSNGTTDSTNKILPNCGANFCMVSGGHHDNENLHRPPDSEIYEISAIYLACVFVAVLMIALLVDPLSRLVIFLCSLSGKGFPFLPPLFPILVMPLPVKLENAKEG